MCPSHRPGTTYIKLVFFAVRGGGGVGRYGLHAGSRVALVPEIGGGSEFGVLGYLLDEKIIERAFCCDVILQCHDTGGGSLSARHCRGGCMGIFCSHQALGLSDDDDDDEQETRVGKWDCTFVQPPLE